MPGPSPSRPNARPALAVLALWFHRVASPPYFCRIAAAGSRWLGWAALGLFAAGAYGGLALAPPDYQMGDSYRILYIHAPAAWMSMFAYVVMAVAAAVGLIWRLKVAEAAVCACAPLGAALTFCALVSGALWGKPTWGAYWVWDARLTSELVLLFLFLGAMALSGAFDDRRTAARATAVLALVGLVNLPIIHYSVEWWHTLHQGASVARLGRPSMDIRMLIPLTVMFAAFQLYFFSALLNRMRWILLARERGANWVAEAARG